MKPSRPRGTILLMAPLFFATSARAQTDPAASLMEALSLVSGGMLVAPAAAPAVTSDGDRFHVRIPLPKLTAPPNAAINVAATALASGVWDITSLTFPATGTAVTKGAPGTPPTTLVFTIGQQAGHARVDSTLSTPSSYTMALGDIALRIDRGVSHADLAIEHTTLDGTITGDSGGRMTTRSQSRAENVRLVVPKPAGAPFTLALRSADSHYDVDGLNRVQAAQLRQVTTAMAARQQQGVVPPGRAPAPAPDWREQLRPIIEASAGLLTGFHVEETLQGLHFDSGDGQNGTVGQIAVSMEAKTANDHVSGVFALGLHDMTATMVPAQYAPRQVILKTTLSGIGAQALGLWLREATNPGSDPASVQAHAVALLKEPGAKAGIETLLIESGPLVLQGSAQVRPLPDGTAGFDIYLAAHGLDAMIGLIQSDPRMQQAMPMLFLAKGMAKPEGDGLVWVVSVANGKATVNGVPMGQKGSGGPAGRPPANR